MKTFARLRRFTISLRVMMVLVVVLALGLSRVVNRANAQREAVAAITKAGGRVSYDHAFREGKFYNTEPRGPAWLRRILGPNYIDYVTRVDFEPWSKPVVDINSAIPHLTQLDSLESLSLHGTNLDDKNLIRLSEVQSLVELDVTANPIHDRGLAGLKQLGHLEALGLGATQVTDEGLNHLLNLTSLEGIDLTGTRVSEAGVDKISRLPKCRSIVLVQTPISQAPLERLRKKYPQIVYSVNF